MLTRSEARDRLMTILFALALRNEMDEDVFVFELQHNAPLASSTLVDESESKIDPYILKTGLNVIRNLDIIDQEIERYLKGWRVERLATVDMTIMRIAVSEMKYDNDIPHGVSINEAIELAKRYSEEDAYRFINGILGSISRSQMES